MGISEFIVARDKFEADTRFGTLDFPCCACKHRHGTDRDEPCRTCDHNLASVNDGEKQP